MIKKKKYIIFLAYKYLCVELYDDIKFVRKGLINANIPFQRTQTHRT